MMKTPPQKYCSPAMRAMLKNIAAGKLATDGIPRHNLMSTISALKSRGWVGTDGKITETGRVQLRGTK